MLRLSQRRTLLLFIKRCRRASSSLSNHPSTSKKVYNRYDPELKLLSGLDQPCVNTSPLILSEMTEEQYLELYREQIATEDSCFTKVRNIARKSELETMEQVIEGWEWRVQIEQNLDSIIAKREMSRELMVYFNNIDTKKCTDYIISLLFAVLCRGQLSIPTSELDAIFPRIINSLNNHQFFKNLVAEHKIKSEKIFKEYIKYYTDENIARKYTIRDWWYKCTGKFDTRPDCYPSFSEFYVAPVNEITHMLISFIIAHCHFPLYVNSTKEKLKKSWVPAFAIEDVPIHELNPHPGVGNKTDLCKMLKIHPHISKVYCRRHQFEHLYFPSQLLPMKVPPRPWLNRGKYGPNYSFKQNLIRKLEEYPHMDVNEEILERRIRSGEQARPVFDALNLLGATPWKINEVMLEHMMTALEMSYNKSKAGFLKKLDIPCHPKTIWVPNLENFTRDYLRKEKMAENDKNDPFIEEDIMKEYYQLLENLDKEDVKKKSMGIQQDFERERTKREKKRKEQNSLWCWFVYRLVLAKHYANGQIIYFPHNIDFRGRTYPISPQINHMGDDVNRGLLKFAKGKLLGEEGFRWLKLHCINITGKMKRSPLRDRLDYAERHLPQIIAAAEQPFERGVGDWWWKESEEPWQTLAACIEIRDALASKNPHEFCSHLPIHQDGSCNGLQHYAALGRDLKGAREVNLLPEDRPQDIYTTVVESVERMRQEDEGNAASQFHEIAMELRKLMPKPLERKIIKQTVMTTVYGVTQYGARGQIKRQLVDKEIPGKEASKFGSYLARRTFDGLTDAFQNSMELMDWFKSSAGQVLKLKRPMEWVTPLGLPVIQPYVTIEKVDGQLCFLPVPHKQKNAFPPNFVHSLDSTHMMLTALHCHVHGVTFAAIHDCFWTHACDVDQMNRVCREQFIALHQEPIIQKLSESFYSTYLTDDLRQVLPEKLLAELEEALRPSLKPGELDINQVRNSTYFFS